MRVLVEDGGVVRTPFPPGTMVEVMPDVTPGSPIRHPKARDRFFDDLLTAAEAEADTRLNREQIDAIVREERESWNE